MSLGSTTHPLFEGLEARRLLAGLVFNADFDRDVQSSEVHAVHDSAGREQLMIITGDAETLADDATIWTTDGHTAPHQLASFAKGMTTHYLGEGGNYYWFERSSEQPRRQELWSMDRSTGIAKRVVDDLARTYPTAVGTLAGRTLFYVQDSFGSDRLETSDGSSIERFDAAGPALNSYVRRAIQLNGDRVLLEMPGELGRPRFLSVSLNGRTFALDYSIDVLVQSGGYAYFSGAAKNGKHQVWRTDGESPDGVTSIFNTKEDVTVLANGPTVAIVDETRTYVVKHGAPKPLSKAIHITKGSAFAATQSTLLAGTGSGIVSLDLATGQDHVIRTASFSAAQTTFSTADQVIIEGLGRTDGRNVDREFGGLIVHDNATKLQAVADRVFFIESGRVHYAEQSVAGTVFDDRDADEMRDAGEAALSGVRIYADVDGNGRRSTKEPSDITDAQGHYALLDVPAAKKATLRVVPDIDHFDPGRLSTRTGDGLATRDVGLPRAGKIHAVAFGDQNRDGQPDPPSNYNGFAQFWLDLDRNGIRDADEPQTLGAHQLLFGGLKPGRYQVRAAMSHLYTTPEPGEVTTADIVELTVTGGSTKTVRFGIFDALVGFGTPPNP